jgi:CRP/FNR family transcriptional regulator, anaerobic regulatory protein
MYTHSNAVHKTESNFSPAIFASNLAEPETLRDIFSGQIIEQLEPGEPLFWQGDEARHVFEIVSGALRTVRVLSDGRRVITGFLFPGDVVGVSLKDRYLTTVEAIADTEVRRFARGRFEATVERVPALRPLLMARLFDEMAAAQDQVVLLARKNAEERVATFLLALVRRAGLEGEARPVIALPMTRLDMADYLGLTIETVSRIMSRLAARGIAVAAARHEIAIRRPAALASLAVDDESAEGDDYECGRTH